MSSDREKWIKAVLVFDILGRPPEHLVETLNELIKKMSNEKGIKVNSKQVHEPVSMKEQKDFYTTFAEVEIEAEQISNLVSLMFGYMPAHVEILSPENISLSNSGWSTILSEITAKLHAYDEIARVIQIEKGILETRLREALAHNEKSEIGEDNQEERKKK